MSITYVSLCDGIGAVHVAWRPLGWQCLWTSEIDPFACAVVQHHWHMPNLGDMTTITEQDIHECERPDLVVGGTPCQSFSLAGRRKGLDDPRGNLALVFLRVVGMAGARWVVWENVPGVLSSSRGRDFGVFLGALGQLGYGYCWRVLDGRFFGVPQRRRRVFVVGHLGDWRPAAAVLLEPESLRGHSQAGRPARSHLARAIAGGTPQRGQRKQLVLGFSGKDDGGDATDGLCPTFRAGAHRGSHANGGNWPAVVYPLDLRNTGRDRPGMGLGEDGEPAPTCTAGSAAGVAYAFQPRIGRSGRGQPSDVVPALAGTGAGATSDSRPCVVISSTSVLQTVVRRLTPRECERLQGFPDDYTLIPFRGKPAADGPRYRALGNSMAVPVVAWIGRRIDAVDRLIGRTQSMSRQRTRRKPRPFGRPG